ncbi:MAG: PA14 domain-containing protein [Verrucomicrobiota bacterium]|nr:PA14 domain-containing protein [Verrucomicrobiota bacterium]
MSVIQLLKLPVMGLIGAIVATNVATAAVGGGYTDAGLVGDYYTSTDLTGSPAFTRKEVRLNFDWGTVLPVGGSIAEPYKSFPVDNFSVRYTGQVIAAFTETYTLKATCDDGVRVYLKIAGGPTWTVVIDQWNTAGTYTGTFAMTQGTRYDIRVEYRELTGTAALILKWSSANTPEEVIDPVMDLGFNVSGSWGQAYADIVKCARNGWEGVDGGARPNMDANGWPQGNCAYVFQESLNQGLDIDPLMRGTITFSFTGKATVSIQGNCNTLSYSYNAGTNTTTGTYKGVNNGWNASTIQFRNTDRTGQSPARNNGITDLKLMRPIAPDSNTSYANDIVFNSNIRAAMAKYTTLRVDLNNANQERFWSDRTPPAWFNQSGGVSRTNVYLPNWGNMYSNGASWEHKVMLCNETGRDLFVNLPMMASGWTSADTTSYVYKLAQLIKYGSDGVEPYSAPTANPVYPPLNPNLRVYVELSNEVWNFFSDAFRQYGDLTNMTRADVDAALSSSTDPLARGTDFAIINFDNLSTAKNGSNEYTSIYTWRLRKMILRGIQISNIFRSIYGDDAMHTRIRPLYQWQYADANGTASGPLKFVDDYFNNGDGIVHSATPRPVSYFFYGGGGASYYGAANGYGTTNIMNNSSFETPAIANGYSQAPAGATWTFTGTAGIARDAGAGDDIPAPYQGSQAGYIDGTGSMTITVAIPSTQTSNIYSFVFKAVQRVKTNAPLDGNGNPIADTQKLKLFVNGVASNAKSFNQGGDGFTPTAWNSSYPWESWVVFWTRGTAYYSSNTFTASAGSTVTLRIDGLGTAGNIAFIEDVRLASIDQMYLDAFPGGGEALGQPPGSGYQNELNIQANWALAFGLKYTTYEGGWSLGSDTGGSPMQNKAKYGDSRSATVNATALNMFHYAGGELNTLGTYAQWPSWGDAFAVEGLIDLNLYPLIQGQDDRLRNLRVTPSNGVFAPALMNNTNKNLGWGNSNATLNDKGWVSWNVIVPKTGTYAVAASTTAGGTVRLAADDVTAIATGASGGTLTGNVTLTAGIHSLKVRATSGSFTINQVTILATGAPTAPTITSITDGNLSLSLGWSTVSGVSGYRVRWGTASGSYTNSMDVGSATNFTITGLTHNATYYVAVGAYNAFGESLPSAERVAVALADGQSGTLAAWDLLAVGSIIGDAVSANASATSSRVSGSAITRGAGFTAGNLQAYQGAGAINTRTSNNPTTLAAAKTGNYYFQWTVAPVAGYRMGISSVKISGYSQGSNGMMTVEYSANGFTSAGTEIGTFALNKGWSGVTSTLNTSAIAALQTVESSTVTFRAYIYNGGGYADRGIGQINGNNNDIEITGTLLSLLPPTITTLALPDGTFNQGYSTQLQATGGSGVLNWTISSGALPTGLGLSTTGLLSGTPTE